MVNQKDIFTALQNGEDPQVIANAFAEALNAAIKEKAEADKKAAEATKAAENAQRKITCMDHILNELFDFLAEFYPEIYVAELRERINAVEVVKVMDEARDEAIKMQPVFDDLQKLLNSFEVEHPELKRDYQSRHTAKPAADPIEVFLRSNGLKM